MYVGPSKRYIAHAAQTTMESLWRFASCKRRVTGIRPDGQAAARGDDWRGDAQCGEPRGGRLLLFFYDRRVWTARQRSTDFRRLRAPLISVGASIHEEERRRRRRKKVLPYASVPFTTLGSGVLAPLAKSGSHLVRAHSYPTNL